MSIVPLLDGGDPGQLDFTSSYPVAATHIRPSNATGTGPNGYLYYASSNVGRIDFDPVTLAPRGLIMETVGSTNFAFPSNAAGLINSPAGGTASYAVATGPDGATSFNAFTEDTATNAHRLTTNGAYALTNTAPYTVSVYIKPIGRTFFQLAAAWAGTWTADFDLTGAGTVGAVVGCTATIANVGNGTYRLSATATAVSTSGGFHMAAGSAAGVFTYLGTGVVAFQWFGAQIEQADRMSSYIPTVGATVARSPDSITGLPLTALGGIKQDVGTFAIELTPSGRFGSQDRFILSLENTARTNRVAMLMPNYAVDGWCSVGANLGTAGPLAANTTTTAKLGYQTTNNICYYGSTAVGDLGYVATAFTSDFNTLYIGRSNYTSTQGFDGWIRKVRYIPQRLSNAITAGIKA